MALLLFTSAVETVVQIGRIAIAPIHALECAIERERGLDYPARVDAPARTIWERPLVTLPADGPEKTLDSPKG